MRRMNECASIPEFGGESMKRTTGDAKFDDRLSCVVDFLHY